MADMIPKQKNRWESVRRIFELILYSTNFLVAALATGLAFLGDFRQPGRLISDHQAILAIVAFFSLTFLYERFGLLRELLTGHQELKDDLGMIRGKVSELTGIKRLRDDLHELEVNLDSWKTSLQYNARTASEESFLENMWAELVSIYLDQENNRLEKRTLTSTSEVYTLLVRRLTETLHDDVIKTENVKICRLHITGMLPEEFFNGPQIEYTLLDRSPIIFCHAFEKEEYSESHYKSEEDINKLSRLEIKRCIMVREKNAPEEFSALSTLDALREQFELSIRQGGKKHVFSLLNNESSYEPYLNRLFIHCGDRIRQFQESTHGTAASFIGKIVSSNNYHYYPIAKTSEILDDKSDHHNLIDYFKEYFGREIYYFCGAEKEGTNTQLKRHFRLGGWPEVTLFGLLHKNQRTTPDNRKWSEEVDWKVGIESHYIPLTRQMELWLLDSSESKDLIRVFAPWLTDKTLLDSLQK